MHHLVLLDHVACVFYGKPFSGDRFLSVQKKVVCVTAEHLNKFSDLVMIVSALIYPS